MTFVGPMHNRVDAHRSKLMIDLPWPTLVQLACLAPSSHNTQPWRFRIGEAGIDLLADRTRALPVNDPDDRELTISCGAALFNLRCAAAAAGRAVEVALLPDTGDADWLAAVRPAPGAADPDLALLASLVPERRTWRLAFGPSTVSEATIDALVEAAALEGARLVPVTNDAQRDEVAALVAEGDRIQWHDPRWRRELAMWMHPRRSGDGLTVPALAQPVAQAVVRTFDLGNGVAAKDRELAAHSPLLAVLSTAGDTPQHWLAAGQALQRVLLVAVELGLQASYLNQPIQVAELRPRIAALAGSQGNPQLLLRFGHPNGALPPAPRRAVEAIIEVASGSA
jgi:nitroreductase